MAAEKPLPDRSGMGSALSDSRILEFLDAIERPGSPDARRLMDRVLLQFRRFAAAAAGQVYVLRHDGERRVLERRSIQTDVGVLKPDGLSPLAPERCIAAHVAATREAIFVADVESLSPDLPYGPSEADRASFGCVLGASVALPLTAADGEVVGVVQLYNRAGGRPFEPEQFGFLRPIIHIVAGLIERAEMMVQIARQNERLIERNDQLARSKERIEALNVQTEEAFMTSIALLARAAELHDAATASHVQRLNLYSAMLAERCGMPAEFRREIGYSAALHDVGKMSIDVAILRKQGSLDPAERAEMMRHAEYGWEILRPVERLRMAAEIAHAHHEKWDGSGYPRGLAGQDIPLAARMVAVGDVYDALRQPRGYKGALSHEAAVAIMLNGDERIIPACHFDPALLAVFTAHHHDFREIYAGLPDE